MKFKLNDSYEKNYMKHYRSVDVNWSQQNPDGTLTNNNNNAEESTSTVGGNSNETLSVKQADKIIDDANKIMTYCVNKMEEKNEIFVKKVSTIWEDKNAVEYMKTHKNNFDSFVKELSDNNKVFAEKVQEIANAYIEAGGMSVSVTAAPVTLTANFIINAVKEFFTNGENSDEFGFKNPTSGADQVMDAFAELKTSLEKVASDVVNQIKGINAFGNLNVQLNLAQSAGTVVDILNNHIYTAEQEIREYVGQTFQKYKNIGASAEASAKISTN